MRLRLDPVEDRTNKKHRSLNQMIQLPRGSMFIVPSDKRFYESMVKCFNLNLRIIEYDKIETMICGNIFPAWDYDLSMVLTEKEYQDLLDWIMPCIVGWNRTKIYSPEFITDLENRS